MPLDAGFDGAEVRARLLDAEAPFQAADAERVERAAARRRRHGQ
jgi:hypothetical protein